MNLKIAHFKMPRVSLPRVHFGGESDEHEKREWHDKKREKHHDYYDHADYGLSEVFEDVHERIKLPPRTWHEYYDKPGGMMAIVEMEHKELMDDKAKNSKAGVENELVDLAAACIAALRHLRTM